MKMTRNRNGLTLVELLVALAVSSIILTAVATLAFALSSAHNSTEDMSFKQMQIRFATLKLSNLIRHCRLVCFSGDNDVALWVADKNNNKQLNISELVYIDKGSESDHLQIYEFPSSESDPNVILSNIDSFSSGWWSSYISDCNDPVVLVPECNNVRFRFDRPPPQSKFVDISFELTEDGITHEYRIDSTLRNRAGNLLNSAANEIVSDDD